jgi:hypothetical protein
MLDSDLDADPELSLMAARTAIKLLDLRLAERLARAASVAGGGIEAHLTLCYSLVWQGRGTDADHELAALAVQARTDPERAQVASQRAHNLFWTLHRTAEAEAVLEDTGRQLTDPGARQLLAAQRAAFHADLGRPRQAADIATKVLAAASLSDQAVAMATWGLAGGLAMLGRADQINTVIARGYAAAARAPNAAVLRMGLRYRHMLAFKLAGYLYEAERVALETQRESEDKHGWFPLAGLVLLGQAVLASGHVDGALLWLREARAGLDPLGDIGGWLFRCRLGLTQALAMAGGGERGQASPSRTGGKSPPGIRLPRAGTDASQGMGGGGRGGREPGTRHRPYGRRSGWHRGPARP